MTNLQILIEQAEALATIKYDGHLTIMKFTTGWKVGFGTPSLDLAYRNPDCGREQLLRLPAFKTLEEALTWLIINDASF